MADCEHLPTCEFFRHRMSKMPAVTQLTKDRLCHGNHATCARYQVAAALGRDRVPLDLFPHDIEKAKVIVSAQKKPGSSALAHKK